MAQRLMTSFCFASQLAAALIAAGQLRPAVKPAPLRPGRDDWFIPFEAVGGAAEEVFAPWPALAGAA
jgi:hypothetical protein